MTWGGPRIPSSAGHAVRTGSRMPQLGSDPEEIQLLAGAVSARGRSHQCDPGGAGPGGGPWIHAVRRADRLRRRSGGGCDVRSKAGGSAAAQAHQSGAAADDPGDGGTEGQLEALRRSQALWPKYLGYVVRFLVIGLFWLGHHRKFRLIQRYDTNLLILNIFMLMLVLGMVNTAIWWNEFQSREVRIG